MGDYMTVTKIDEARVNSSHDDKKCSKRLDKSNNSNESIFKSNVNKFCVSTLTGGILGTIGGIVADTKFENFVYSKYSNPLSGLSIDKLPKTTKFFFKSGIFPFGIAALGLGTGILVGKLLQKDTKHLAGN